MTIEEADALNPKPNTEYVFATKKRFEEKRIWVRTDREKQAFVFSWRMPNGKTAEDRREFADIAYIATKTDYEICKAKMKDYIAVKDELKNGIATDLNLQELTAIADWLKTNHPLFAKWQKLGGQ